MDGAFPLFESADKLAAFLLVFMRMSGMIVVAPLFSSRTFPIRIRVWLAVLLSGVTFEVAYQLAPEGIFAGIFRQPTSAALAVAGELAIGWLIGFTASIMMWAAQLAGHLFGQEIGLALSDLFDPVSESPNSPPAQLFFTLALLLFVMMDGHHLVYVAITKSFSAAPPGGFPFGYDDSMFVAKELGSEMWRMGLRIALPGAAALLLVTVALGFLARAVPEMNIFIVGFSIRIVFGLVAIFVITPYAADVFRDATVTTEEWLGQLLDMWESERR